MKKSKYFSIFMAAIFMLTALFSNFSRIITNAKSIDTDNQIIQFESVRSTGSDFGKVLSWKVKSLIPEAISYKFYGDNWQKAAPSPALVTSKLGPNVIVHYEYKGKTYKEVLVPAEGSISVIPPFIQYAGEKQLSGNAVYEWNLANVNDVPLKISFGENKFYNSAVEPTNTITIDPNVSANIYTLKTFGLPIFTYYDGINNGHQIQAEFIKIDKAKLSAKITEAEALSETPYTAESWSVLTAALSSAKAVNIKLNASQEEVDSALDKLNTAVNNLVLKDPWTLVWADEFDGTSLNPNKWGFQEGNGAQYGIDGWGNNEQEYYRGENAKVANGELVIEAKKESYGGKPYTSSRLWTQPTFSKKYGKFEARIKLPEGQGFWPAFWLMPKDEMFGPWAASGEIDIMEAKGRLPGEVSGTLHYGKTWPNNKFTGKQYFFPEGQSISGFHTYSLEWEPGEIRWYVDGNLYQTQNNWYSYGVGQPDKYSFPAPFNQEFYIILNLAVGGNFDGNLMPDPSTASAAMEVDYVRVYDLTGRPYKTPVEPVTQKEPLPADAKQAINGNYVYDVNYEKPITEIATSSEVLNKDYWNLVHVADFGGNGTAAVEPIDGQNFAKINITNGGSQAYSVQFIQNVTLGKGRAYKLSFDAKAAAQRSMSVKLGGGAARSWSAYTDNFDVPLKDQLQHYEYRFQMSADTDTLARLEFNMGLNTSSVWIGNVKLEEIDTLIDPNGAKKPLINGNHVYNGTFDLGTIDSLSFWNFDVSNAEAKAVVDADTKILGVQITNGGTSTDAVQLVQKGINLLQRDKYELTFDAKAAAQRDITVKFMSKDSSTTYFSQNLSLSTSMETQKIDFAMPVGVTDIEGQLVFCFGGNSSQVFMDNIKLMRLTNYNIDYSGVDIFPLQNGSFALGLYKWSTYAIEAGSAAFSAANGEAKISVNSVGAQPWSIMFNQENMSFTKGFEYVLSFDARSTVTRDIEISLENSGYIRSFQTGPIILGPETKHFEYTFTVPNNDMLSLKYLMGKTAQSPTAAHDIYLSNVVLEIKNAPVKQPPVLLPDNTDNKIGQSVEITFNDDPQWRASIQAVKVDNTPLSSAQYSVVSGKIIISADSFTADRSYNISVEAADYATCSVIQQMLPNEGNLILNGSMTNGSSNWGYWTQNDDWSDFSVENGAARLDIYYNGGIHPDWNVPINWSTQFYQEGIKLEAGKTYELSFRAWSTVDRPIRVEFNGLGTDALFNITSNSSTVYKAAITPASNTTLKLIYCLGDVINGTNLTPDGPHTIYIDDVVLH